MSNVNIRTDIWELLNELKTHPYSIIKNDRPARLKIGFECEKTGQRWEIGIVDLKKSLDAFKQIDPIKAKLIRESVKTAEGMANLIQVINADKK